MWSIHPDQIRPIVEAFAPTVAEIDQAIEILLAAQAATGRRSATATRLHDRASYRYFWHVLERAQRTGQPCRSRCARPSSPTTPEARRELLHTSLIRQGEQMFPAPVRRSAGALARRVRTVLRRWLACL